MGNFALGMVAGGIVAVLALALLLRVVGQPSVAPPLADASGGAELTVTLSRDLLQQLIADGLREVSLPLVTLRDPFVQLEPDARIVLRLRGDTILLGGQLIVVRMRVLPAEMGVRVQTEAVELRGLGDVGAGLSARLDRPINAELERRLAFARDFAVLDVGGTTEEVTIRARLRD